MQVTISDLEFAAHALGLPLPLREQKEARRKAPEVGHLPGRTVTLSVRKRDSGGAPYGNTLTFTHTARSVFRTGALIEAERAARAAGFEPWIILDDGGDS